MIALATRLRTLWALGLPNLARVAGYRLALRLGVHPAQRIAAEMPTQPFFGEVRGQPIAAKGAAEWSDRALLFGFHSVDLDDGPPDWLANPLTGRRGVGDDRPWWTIPDFSSEAGDIKTVWEFSRMDWALAFAQRARTGDERSRERLNAWLDDWCTQNPPYRGPNWKCGQEASIRVLHLAVAALILGQVRTAEPGLCALIDAHLRRIAPTMAYAAAQNNNHATSEAVALFVGGSWLAANGRTAAQRYARQGRTALERHVARLVEEDGSFSQYSLNYHRVMLDTLSVAEIWRRELDLPPFSERWYARARAATDWLVAMVDPESGDAPNLGANDGARLLQLTPTGYRDYRPSAQLAAALFRSERVYPPGLHDGALAWLGMEAPASAVPDDGSRLFDNGGYAVLRSGPATAMLRYPRFRFRPSQADALHLDLWVDGENLLRDAGTYSYNAGAEWIDYFGGIAAHNSIQFDDSEQMPRLGRFLLGDWLSTERRTPITGDGETCFAASYRDRGGRFHERSVALTSQALTVVDQVGGFDRKAVLRWRLRPGEWVLTDDGATDGAHRLRVTSDAPVIRRAIVTGQESHHYLQRSELPVLEIEIDRPARLESEYRWSL